MGTPAGTLRWSGRVSATMLLHRRRGRETARPDGVIRCDYANYTDYTGGRVRHSTATQGHRVSSLCADPFAAPPITGSVDRLFDNQGANNAQIAAAT
jgi:hypothetical protein